MKKVWFRATSEVIRHLEVGTAACRYVSGDHSLTWSDFLRRSTVIMADFWIHEARKKVRVLGVAGPAALAKEEPIRLGRELNRFLDTEICDEASDDKEASETGAV